MKQKTPMQKVYENFNLMSDADFKAWMLNTDLLKKEKEVMCEFALRFNNDAYYNIGKMISIQDYYNETFNTKEK